MNLEGTPFVVEPMTVEDVPTVVAIENTVFSLPWSANTFAHELKDNPHSVYLVVRYLTSDHRPPPRANAPRLWQRLFPPPPGAYPLLGYGGFWLMLEEAHICTLALHPEWRGRGLGELLLASLIEQTLERKAEVVTLEVRATNARAQQLYRKYGFLEVGRRKGYYTDNGEDALIMTTPVITEATYQHTFQHLCASLRERLKAQPNPSPVGSGLETSI